MITTRSFLLAGLIPWLAAAHPPDLRAPGGPPLTIATQTGSGEHVYRVDPSWGTLPDGKPLGPTHGGVAVDQAGNVYTSTDAAHAIVVFKPDGSFLKSIAPDCVGLHGLTIREEDGKEYLYGAHGRGQRVVKLTLDGEILMEIPNGKTGEIPAGFKGLTSVAVAPDGSIFAACGYGSNLVHKFDAGGTILKTMGGKGKGDGKFTTCHGLVIDDRGEEEPLLLVMDRENRRLVHLTQDLEWKGVHAEGLRRPCAASVWGDFVAVAELAGRVAIVGPDGTVVAELGDNPKNDQRANFKVPAEEMVAGVFTAPHGISYDSGGNIYVQEWNATGRITKLVKGSAEVSEIPMEDNFEDILGKALRGTGIADEMLEFLTGVPAATIGKLKDGEADDGALRQVAGPLGLDAGTLVERAHGSWRPEPVAIDGLRQFNSVYGDMTVNCYLVWDPASKEAALFDTGSDASAALECADELGVQLTALYLTHTHRDHIMDREAVLAHSPGIPVQVNSLEAAENAVRFQTGDAFSIGTLRVSTRLTRGHSPGGSTYVIHGLDRPVAIVGDALFAQSMGGGMISYQEALATNRGEIFSLSDDTVICPGHGPMTSVGEEKAHNPFFPEFK